MTSSPEQVPEGVRIGKLGGEAQDGFRAEHPLPAEAQPVVSREPARTAFIYGSSSAAGVRTNGRLETATRYNSVGSPSNATVAVTETYAYGARQGRASSRTTQMFFNGAPSESFTQGWTWNALGDLGSLSYPQCAFAACAPSPRTVSPAPRSPA